MPSIRFFWMPAIVTLAVLLFSCGEKPKPQPVYGMGEKVTVGHLIYTVLESQWLTQLGQGANTRVPQNRFFVVHVIITNAGGSQASVPSFTLEDEQGNSHSELTNGDQVTQWLGALKMVSPADSIQGTVVFDVVPRRYRLRVLDENGQQSALIDIPFNLTPDAPAIPQPEQK